MKKALILLGVVIVIGAGAVAVFLEKNKTAPVSVNSFEECAAAGYPVMESYPRQCSTSDGHNFREEIGNELEKSDLIRLQTPRPNGLITSPLTIVGQARGNWFFEASFPVELYDDSGRIIATAVAQARSDWMTEEFVPFEAELKFDAPAGEKGILVLKKDNPSGLPEKDNQLRVPVKFKQ